LSKRVLVVIPPAVRTQWVDTFNEFGIGCCDVVSLASLDKVVASTYEMVVVDESHKFKNSESKRYKQLYKIALNKKVILLSATPQNNTPRDLYNQIALFQNVKNSTLPNCKNLQSFFVEREKRYKEIINNKPIDNTALKNISEEIRDNILRTVMIRRTRYDIEHHNMYKADIEEQGLSIPKVNPPIEHEYKLEGELGKIFDNTAIKITHKLNYSRFNLLHYLTQKAQQKYYPNESKNIFVKNPLAGLMKVLLVKRFESSFCAFKTSINRHLQRYEKFLENYENDIIYLGEMATDILDFDAESDEDYDVFIQNLIEKGRVKQLKRSDFKKGFEANLKSDLAIFQELVESWREVEDDPKLDKFREILAEDRDKKVVIFTESVDTLNYLKSKLCDTKKTLFITSQNRDEKKSIIQENFDANYDKSKQRDDYNIIITTDTLAEGINLHQSSIVYNYDIPWNATKLIQRIGRVNRIGTRAKFITIHNFKPASHIDNLIELSQKAFVKLQSSHTMMGEDNQIYTKDEKVSSVNLFESYKQESLERDEELVYLEELRDFRDSNPKEFRRIKELKEGLTIARRGDQEIAYVVLDINGDKKYLSVDSEVKPISFMEIAEVFRAKVDERGIRVNRDKYSLRAIEYCQEQIEKSQRERAEGRADGKIEEEVRILLKEWLKKRIITRAEFKEYRDTINHGMIGAIAIDEVRKLRQDVDREIAKELKDIMAQRKRVEVSHSESEIKTILTMNLIEDNRNGEIKNYLTI
jgi:superfamily II DNA/RNA helicase